MIDTSCLSSYIGCSGSSPAGIQEDTGNISLTRDLYCKLRSPAYRDVQTLEAAPGVVTLTVPPVTRSQALTLVNILARSSVGRNPRDDHSVLYPVQYLTSGLLVSIRAATPIAAWLIVALAHAPVILLTLVNVNTTPAVGRELVTLPAVASVGAPQVRAVVAADIGYFHALINISTSLAGWLETLLADTSVGA